MSAAASVIALLTSLACSAAHDAVVPEAVLAAFHSIALQPVELGLAAARATQQCLRQRGYDVPQPLSVTGSVANLPLPMDETRAEHGYGSAINREPGDDPDPIERYAKTLPQGQRAAFERVVDDRNGPLARVTTPNGRSVSASRTGCVADGRNAVYGSVDNWLMLYYLPQDLNKIAADVYLEQSVRDAATTYRECMNGNGYNTEFPQDAVKIAETLARAPGNTREPSSAEIRLAKADAACQGESRIVEACLSMLDQNARPWITGNADLVTRAGSIVGESRERAYAIMTEAP